MKSQLSGLGCDFSETKVQDDRVFAVKGNTLEVYLANKVFVRIRIENGNKTILTAKKPIRASDGLVKIEHETIVESALELELILAMMGLMEIVRTKKSRTFAHYQRFEICIDDIENLGTFIEVEALADESEAENLQVEMFSFLKSLGITDETRVTKGYDILMFEKTLLKASS